MELEDYNPADLCLALCRMVSYNIGHLAYLNAKRYNLKRIFFGGFFIRGHPYTMDTLSFAIQFWSKVRACLAWLGLQCHVREVCFGVDLSKPVRMIVLCGQQARFSAGVVHCPNT